MGKDFRAGLIAGAVLVGIALIWVATRPSMSPQARMARAVQPAAGTGQVSDRFSEAADPTPSGPPGPQAPEPQEPLRAGGTTDERASASPQPGVGEPRADVTDLTIYEMNEPIKTTRFHIVRKGETLSAIAQQYYGSSDKWRKILAANSKTIKDANKIAPGTKLTIPE